METTRISEDALARRIPQRWALTGVVAGVLGIIATLITDDRVNGTAAMSSADIGGLSRQAAWAGLVAGYGCITCLIVLSAQWRHIVESSAPFSVGARVVSTGLTAAAGALMLGYGWKGALAIYLPGGMDASEVAPDVLFVYYVLNDFGSFIGWFGIIISAGGVCFMSLSEGVLSRWLGWMSLPACAVVAGFAITTGLPGFAGVVGPVWLVLAFLAISLGKCIRTPPGCSCDSEVVL